MQNETDTLLLFVHNSQLEKRGGHTKNDFLQKTLITNHYCSGKMFSDLRHLELRLDTKTVWLGLGKIMV